MAVLPPYIQSLLKAHSFLSSHINSLVFSNEATRAFYQVRNAEVKRRVLLSPNPRNEPEFSDLLRDYSKPIQSHIQSIFEKPIIGEVDDVVLARAIRAHSPIVRTKSLKRKTDFSSQAFQEVFSNYFPLKMLNEDETKIREARVWTEKLLNTTPFVFILKQTNRLLSDSSLNQVHPSRTRIQDELQKLAVTSKSGRFYRSYHFSTMRNLALLNECLGGEEDSMVQELIRNIEFEVTDEYFKRLPLTEEYLLKLRINEFPTERMQIPYDLKYTTYHVVTIERSIKRKNHTKFLKVLEDFKDDFQVMGVRIPLQSEWIVRKLIGGGIFGDNRAGDSGGLGTYSEIIDNIKKVEEPSSFEQLMRGLGELGLTKVKQGSDYLYLMKE